MVRALQLLEGRLTSIKEHSGKVKQVQHLEVPLDLHMGLLGTAYINRARLQLEDRLRKVHLDRAKQVHKGQLEARQARIPLKVHLDMVVQVIRKDHSEIVGLRHMI